MIDGSFNDNILPLINVSLQDAQKIGNIKIVCTWIALKLLELRHKVTEDEWKFIALKGKNFIK